MLLMGGMGLSICGLSSRQSIRIERFSVRKVNGLINRQSRPMCLLVMRYDSVVRLDVGPSFSAHSTLLRQFRQGHHAPASREFLERFDFRGNFNRKTVNKCRPLAFGENHHKNGGKRNLES
jgi:hypothetical protein